MYGLKEAFYDFFKYHLYDFIYDEENGAYLIKIDMI